MLKHKLYNYKHFWKTKFLLKKIDLKYDVFKFKIKEKVLIEKQKLSTSRIYLFEITKNILKAFIFVFAIYLIEFVSQYIYLNYSNSFPNWLNTIIGFVPKPSYPEGKDSINSFISLLASISGLLLALFYPILATIASTGYSKVNSSIRSLLFLEPITQNYLRRLAFLTAYSVYTLLFIIFGYYPGNLILIYLSFLALKSLFNLLKIGSGVYGLFQPETLIQIAGTQIIKNMQQVKIQNVNWNKETFQHHFRKQVEKQLETIKLLNFISLDGAKINSKSFLETSALTLKLLEYYLSIKSNIPLKSKWFQVKVKYQSYFESDSHLRELSINAHTYNSPKEILNTFWFEESILNIYSEIGSKIDKIENQDIRFQYLHQSVNLLKYFGYSFEYGLANKLLFENLRITKNSLINDNTYNKSKSNLMIIETMISLSIRDYQISFFQKVESLNKDSFNNEILKIDWNNKSSLYKLNIPYKLNAFLDENFKFIENEKMIEGKQITPNWYVTQHLTAEYLLIVKNNFKELIKQIIDYAIPLIKHCIDNKNYLSASFASHCTLELINKIEFRLPRIINLLNQFDENNLHKNFYKWAKINEEKERKKLIILKKRVLYDIVTSYPKIATLDWNDDNPDVFARSFAIISNEINKCFIENDVKKFERIFPVFIKNSLKSFFSIYDRYKEKYEHPFAIIYQVHIELLQLSGISYIYSEITNEPFWKIVVESWNSVELLKEEIDLIIASYIYYYTEKYSVGANFIENRNRRENLYEFVKSNNIEIENFKTNIIYDFISNVGFSENNYEEIFLELYIFTFINSKESIKNVDTLTRRRFFQQIKRIY